MPSFANFRLLKHSFQVHASASCLCKHSKEAFVMQSYGSSTHLFHWCYRKTSLPGIRNYSKISTSSDSLENEKNHANSTSRISTERELKRMKIKPAKERPTVFYDSLRVLVKGGRGGQGLPNKGGIGGRGGDVVVVGHKNVNLKKVSDLYPTKRFAASHGNDAKLFCLYGEPAKPLIFPVPVGVSVITEFGQKLGDINMHGDKLTVAKGGIGGSPSNGYSAENGQSHSVMLDLKLIADVAFVGFPNAGKSTLLKALSRAVPKIASYPFTTVRPNVGVIEFPDLRQISLADLPGLIEGAHANIGMGHKFLKHVERTKILLFIVDIHGFQLSPQFPKRSALDTITLLNRELELYKEELTEKPAILALNKFDLPGSYELIEDVKNTLNDRCLYERFLKSLPSEFVPNKLIQFDEIISISAAKDTLSVNQLQNVIRRVLDLNDIDTSLLVPLPTSQ